MLKLEKIKAILALKIDQATFDGKMEEVKRRIKMLKEAIEVSNLY